MDKNQAQSTTPDFDDLLAESKVTDAPELLDLDALLSESVTEVQEAKAAKLAKDRLKRGGSYAEKAEDLARIRDWEAKHEWEAIANSGLFIQHQCACGSVYNVWGGLFSYERHRHVSNTFRWNRVETSNAKLPNQTILQVVHDPVCDQCHANKGWNTDPDGAATIVWEDTTGEVEEELEELQADLDKANGRTPQAEALDIDNAVVDVDPDFTDTQPAVHDSGFGELEA